MKPERIQLKRTKGWKMPANTVKVDRTTRFGNPFKNGELCHIWHREGGWPYNVYLDCIHVSGAEHAIRLFAHAMAGKPDWYPDKSSHKWERPDISPLRGKNLACWCKPGSPCHADVLLELANQ